MKSPYKADEFKIKIYHEDETFDSEVVFHIKIRDKELAKEKTYAHLELMAGMLKNYCDKRKSNDCLTVEISSLLNKDDSEEYVQLNYDYKRDHTIDLDMIINDFSNDIVDQAAEFYKL